MTETPEQQNAAAPKRFPGRRFLTLPPPLPAWWPVPACALLGALCAGSYGMLQEAEYRSTGYVVAAPEKDASPEAALGYAQAYGRISTSDSMLSYASATAGVPAASLRARVQTETSPDAPMIAITGTSDTPAEAADIANAVADALLVNSGGMAEKTGVRLVTFTRAVAPLASSSQPVPLTAAVGACAGGLIGGILLLVRPRRPRRTSASPSVPAPAHTTDHLGTEQARV
ncbi:lipopolysaccharide biosynthesis protein [Streptomyces sp. NPDC088745]|uniref:lipopolysaccharide biosynthesis protein n=1 Tax=Streptomyces sp. NPDC088745 TaxID=3365884 RepID=UPI0037F2622F